MKQEQMIAETTITIAAAPEDVWHAITTPAQIKKYLMGTTVKSDFKAGSAITYEGEFNGKKYHDKGEIKKVIPNKEFQSTYWSSAGGKEDSPENYNLVTYKLDDKDGKTKVTLTQDNIRTDKEKEHVTENWKGVLKKLKEVVEAK